MRRGLIGLLAFGGLLELLPRAGLVPAGYLPPSSVIARALAAEFRRPAFWTALGDTLRTWLLGLALAAVAGLVCGIVIGSVPALRTATASTIEFLRPIPSVALIPLAVLLYGTGIRLATSVALVLTITGELVIGTPGLGQEIAVARASNAVPPMYALVIVTGLLGVAANLVTRTAERRILVWHPAVRSEAPA